MCEGTGRSVKEPANYLILLTIWRKAGMHLLGAAGGDRSELCLNAALNNSDPAIGSHVLYPCSPPSHAPSGQQAKLAQGDRIEVECSDALCLTVLYPSAHC
ncbi:hypothetical protein MHYP_G00053160 [Metynnis hypsauchen]